MLIVIHRYRINGKYCDSHLYIEGKHICDCAENAYYRTPVGTYRVQLCHCDKASRKVPTLFPIPPLPLLGDSTPAALAIGNGIHTLTNQILVGTFCVPGVVIRSRDAFIPLYDRINNSQRRGNEVRVLITE